VTRRRIDWPACSVALALLLCMAALCARHVPAQVVHLANYSGSAFEGWKRCTVDVMPPHEAGQVGAARYVLGRRIGLDVRVIDLRVHLEPGEVRSIDLSTAAPWAFARGPLPADPLAFFGAPSIAAVPLQLIDLRADGAAYLLQLRARVGPMLCTNLWTWWYPDQPAWAIGEAVVCASNPAVTDMTATVPTDFRLRFGAADVLVPGAQAGGACLLPAGTIFGDGQARSFPITFVWRQHLTSAAAWSSAGAAASLAIAGNGIARLYPEGNPQLAAGKSPLAWTIEHWDGAIGRLHGWEAGPLGVPARSRQTGAFEDQGFPGAECAVGLPGLGSETACYLVALGQSRRPCHFLEPDGSLIDLAKHPQLVLWDARPHWHPNVSPDQLGKSRGLTELDTHGWLGPDREHWSCNRLAIGARMTGSPALQWQLSMQARLFLLSETIDLRLSTSHADAARSAFYAGCLVVHLHHNLEDRALAARVMQRWQQRVLQVYVPEWGSQVADVWDPRAGEPRLAIETGQPVNWMPDQQAMGALGLERACAIVGPPEGRDLALRGAKAVLLRAYTRDGTKWLEWERLGFAGVELLVPVEGQTAHRTGWYGVVGFPCAIATVLRREPTNEQARSIWAQMLGDSGGGSAWLTPGVPR